ncbi:MAG: uroporphyrinogen-III C-methyltransferase [Myxococcota bacterium]
MRKTEVGKVYLVGAGPGDPELITTRGLRHLRAADVVLYDALVHPDQLKQCRPDAERVFVGKRAGRKSERQEIINRHMVRAARAGKRVVRLKGGDPYLFGRGSEEAEALAAEGIAFEVVPGVPSPMAAAAYTGISLTHRDLASSIAYVTATESPEKDRSAHDWSKLATATQTLVLFMGLRKLEILMQLLVDHGRDAETPAAVVQWASLPRQRTVVGTVGDIAARVREAGIEMPALTIVGDAVRLREQLRWFDARPLFGRRVLVTRPVHQAGSLSQLLRDEGAEPVEAPTIRILPPEDAAALRRAVASLASYGWVVFTSKNGVEAFFGELARQGGDARRLGGARVIAIGPKTAQALEACGVRPDRVPDEYRGEAVADEVLADLGGAPETARVLVPRAREARAVLPERLRAAGARVDVVEAYRTVPPTDEDAARLRALFDEGALDVVTFTSSSTVRNLVDALGPGAAERIGAVTVASIGPITTETARQLGLRVDVTAEQYTTADLVQALRDHFEQHER